MAEYIISEKALDDLNNIWIYTAENWSVEQANRYYNLIMDEIEYVAENFETTKDFGSIRKDYRYSKVKSYLIFCPTFSMVSFSKNGLNLSIKICASS